MLLPAMEHCDHAHGIHMSGSRCKTSAGDHLRHIKAMGFQIRADSIVRDAEALRRALLPGDGPASRWSVLGQSFGGFCGLTYLSMAPEGTTAALLPALYPVSWCML